MTKHFPEALMTDDGRAWSRTADYQEGPGITTNYARYMDRSGRQAYSRGGRALYSIRLDDDWVCQPGHKIATIV